MSEQDQPVIEPFGFLAPLPKPVPTPAPTPYAVWDDHPDGTAWVYLGEGNQGLTRPVILSDGFESGPSSLDTLWEGLERGDYPFISRLREQGYDLVLVGYAERSAAIQRNAAVLRSVVFRAVAERLGEARLTVGGFSMGGLIARYTLAKLEHEGFDHQTALYVSWDSPHNGAWVPISLQALAHFLVGVPALSEQINSPASRQLLWRHIETVDGTPAEDPLRSVFLDELKVYGWWPRVPRLIGVANGLPERGNGVPPGDVALAVETGWFAGTELTTQPSGEARVARLKGAFQDREVVVSGLSELDGAPGGTLETFGIAGDKLAATGKVTVRHRTVGFVPTVSAVAAGTLDEPYAPIDPDKSELDDYKVASANEPHTKVTEELGSWIIERLPR
ncbi:hypothetical protein GCM10022243_58960 [Saccharothrix violaceirubra]|uniref:DUF676 domain-containing protein n=1 Tax=Saccharothrix violaceirubra TaxID=413306 RepID=A0A7W7T1P8_9PSEU|nr:hypothetical protein [Saccharothrix violaceirubra]MBB4964933.1 hypothetical protein [Saccharothrix violaceirubra]